MDATEVIQALWDRFQARDWAGAGDLVAQDAVIEWPASGERITGRASFIAVNREYPEGWSIRVLRIVADGDQVVSEVEVPHADLGVFRAASLWTVTDGLITRGTEYWITVGADKPPADRSAYTEPLT